MKHLIKTADPSSLAAVNYNRVILNTTTDNVTIDYSYVDLGLPSGLKWATRNIGATSETDYGDYFMWGSTTPNTASQCNWSTAPFNNGSSDYDETYFNSVKDTVCPNGILAKEYDAATQIMGDEWRMPTSSDFSELSRNTTKEWVTDYNGSSMNGWKFISKTNGNSIFIPASGSRSESETHGRGSYGNYWTSSLDSSYSYYGFGLYFSSNNIEPPYDQFRFIGQSVRGVRA